MNGHLEFDDATAELPELLKALRRGDDYILLSDGSKGLLPPQWKIAHKLLDVDSSEDDGLRFRPSQALLLDALLEERQARVRVDKGFSTWRNKLKTFVGVKPRSAPRGFNGALRPYLLRRTKEQVAPDLREKGE